MDKQREMKKSDALKTITPLDYSPTIREQADSEFSFWEGVGVAVVTGAVAMICAWAVWGFLLT